jgi:hypothetical protein
MTRSNSLQGKSKTIRSVSSKFALQALTIIISHSDSLPVDLGSDPAINIIPPL